MPNIHEPPAALDRRRRAVAKFIAHRAILKNEEHPPTAFEQAVGGRLKDYWMREARKAAGL